MNHMEKKRKRTTVIIIAAAATVCVLAALAVLFLPRLIPTASGVSPDMLSMVKYVTQSGLDYNESVYVDEKYRVRREGSEPNAGCLEIRCIQYWESSDPKDWITYEVFDSSADARKSYEADYEFIISRGEKRILSKGHGWFIANVPAYDAEIHTIYYLADNVVISADVTRIAQMTTVETTKQQETTAPKVTRSSLSDYIIKNAPDLRRFVLTKICPKLAPQSKKD